MNEINSHSQLPSFDPSSPLTRPLPAAEKTEDFSQLFQEITVWMYKLSSKPRTIRRINSLDSNIKSIEKALTTSKQKIENLEGGKAARIPIIGAIIKFFF